ncbi:flagellar basal-body MS-ring/collar protein FliF [Jeotgalibacillus sp. ET6]|uniref:flagellar basal-body MS-ring/collar protein FliF n=1 Tax=Jeotgalibacillus sp. ET6 TaxID=3037260 RepID=UPI0024185231|nr:flagellar basal-body MS-ring/collar protein FliF [Jeotgalibacillus sp. ET6]MDG5470286.1 flagellar basal-body MS-ring/collar protein FliF [Jeotgalibacillus sp. ET6]
MNESFQQMTMKTKAFFADRPKKQLIIGAVIAAILIISILIISLLSARNVLVPLYSNLTPSETGMIKENLDGRGIPSEITEGGTAILVPEEQVETLMVELAAEGIPQSGNIDYSFFSENAGFGMTDNEFNVLKLDAMQTELAELMKGIEGVQNAQVMITMPEKGVFLDDTAESASASIVLNTKPGYQFDEGQINSLYLLVSKSVPSLPTENIVIMNQFFEYYDQKNSDSSFAGVNVSDQMSIKQTIERDLQRQVQMMLGTLMGQNKVVVSISTDIDFDQENREENLVTPVDEENMEGIEISAQRISETFEGTAGEAGGVTEGGDPGDNLTGFVEGANGSGDFERVEETINNEVNRIRRNIVESPYKVRDIGFQVMVEPPDPDDPASLPQERVDDIETMLETIIRTSIDNEFSADLTDADIAEKVLVSVQPFNGIMTAEEPVNTPVIPWWGYLVAGLLILVIGILVIAMIRARRKSEAAEEAEEEIIVEQKEKLDVPDVNNEKETEGTLRRKQLEKMAREKPEDFAKLLRSWIAED